MSKNEKPENNGMNSLDEDLITDLDTEIEKELPQAQPGLRHRVRKLFENMQQGAPSRQEMAKDRTRSLALLIGGTAGAVLLFIGVFSTPTTPPTVERSGRGVPNLGRGTAPNQPSGPRSSVTPLLNADVGTDNDNSDQLSAGDIQGTSGRASPEKVRSSADTRLDAGPSHAPLPLPRNSDGTGSFPIAGSDPLAAYRLNTSTGTPTYSYGGTPPGGAELSRDNAYGGGAGPIASESRLDAPGSPKSSIVFVRSSESMTPAVTTRSTVTSASVQTSLLPPGTRLAARLEAAATTALKMPAVGSIEYNYERDRMIVVPAGTKVFGDVQQASSEGYVNIRFHTLRLPDGREEAIEGTGVSLDQKPLKGQVSGKNTGKKLLSRTLSGFGTIAAYVVGAGGAGLSRTVTGETLLRDRLASNVALAGEQELTNAAYSQNISVTVPANTRFYLVLQKPAVPATPARIAEPAARSVEMPTVQELRELMDLRREINRMYQESNSSLPRGTKP